MNSISLGGNWSRPSGNTEKHSHDSNFEAGVMNYLWPGGYLIRLGNGHLRQFKLVGKRVIISKNFTVEKHNEG